MNKILVFIFVIIANQSMANDSKAEKYYALIVKAETQFIRGDHAAADSSYGDAFNLFSNPLALDLSNAMVNATKAKNEAAFYRYAKLLSNYGVKSSFFSKRTFFQVWNGSEKWSLLLKQTDANYEKLASSNSNLRNYIDSLFAFSEQKKPEAFETSVNVRDFQNASRPVFLSLNSLFKKQGYITENLIGVTVLNDTTVATSKILRLIEFTSLSPDGNGQVEIALITNYEPVLTKAFNEGEIGWRDYWMYSKNSNADQAPHQKLTF